MRNTALVVTTIVFCYFATGCGDSKAEAEKRRQAEEEKQKQAEVERTKQAILRVFRADQQLHKKLDALPPKSTPSQLAWAVGNYCDDLGKLEMNDCPADFRVAYRTHVGAWREVQAAIKQLPDGFLEGVLMGAMNSVLRGEVDGGTARLEGGLQRSIDRIRDTWIDVEKIGAKYGVAL
jgi:hypothetical protein